MPTLQPDVTVAAVVERAGRFLLVEERIRGRLVLCQPAGHVEDRETLTAAVVREVREETAWLFTPESLLGIYQWRNPDSGITTLRFAFRGVVSDHRADQPLDQPVVATHWLTVEELRRRADTHRSPLVQRCVDDWLQGRSAALDLVADVDLHTAARLRSVQL
jgi:8-oxo-dGTP pyrophosphatase MutT (NUDIX family)